MDTDNKMHLTKAQAKVACRAMGKNPTEAQINEVMKGMSMLALIFPKYQVSFFSNDPR